MHSLRTLAHHILDRLDIGTPGPGFVTSFDADGNRVHVHPMAAEAAEALRVRMVVNGPDELDLALMDGDMSRALDATRARLAEQATGRRTTTAASRHG